MAGFHWLRPYLPGLVLIFFLQMALFQIYRVDGTSMEPTLKPREWLVVNPFPVWADDMKRNDIVVFKHPETKKTLVKRVVGFPGEKVELYDGMLFVDGRPLDQKYQHINSFDDFESLKIPLGEILVLGDNRKNSLDSRFFGTIPVKNIIGRAESVIWPLREISFLK